MPSKADVTYRVDVVIGQATRVAGERPSLREAEELARYVVSHTDRRAQVRIVEARYRTVRVFRDPPAAKLAQQKPCRCLVRDWAGLRAALQISQEQMALLAGCHRVTISRLEHGPHHCAHRTIQVIVRVECERPELQERLKKAGYAFDDPPTE